MMKKFSALIIVFMVLSSTLSYAKIVSTNTITPIKKALSASDKNTLIVTDVEGVLYTPTDQILQPQNKKLLKNLEQEMEKRIGKKEAYKLYSEILKARRDRPANSELPNLIKSLQEKNIKVIALTSCGRGSFGTIPALNMWSIQKLEALGYELYRSWQGFQSEEFSDFHPPKHKDTSPTFNKGILFTCGEDKGEVLKAFIKRHQLKFSKVIFIDDQMPNIISVEKITKDLGLAFEGFYYTESKSWDLRPFNPQRAKVQLENLEKKGKWLSDGEADLIMKNKFS